MQGLTRIDPDNNLFQEVQFNCKYYTENNLNNLTAGKTQDCNTLSILHVNARSLAKKFKSLLLYLELLNVKFDIIALSEVWLNPEEHDSCNLDG